MHMRKIWHMDIHSTRAYDEHLQILKYPPTFLEICFKPHFYTIPWNRKHPSILLEMRFFPDFATIDLLLKLAAAWFLKFCILGIHTRLHSVFQTRVCPHSLSSFAVFIIDLFSFAAEGASSLKSENLKMVEFNFRHLSFIRSSSGSLIASNILFSSGENPFPWSRCKKCSVWILWYFKGWRQLQEHCLFVCFSCAIFKLDLTNISCAYIYWPIQVHPNGLSIKHKYQSIAQRVFAQTASVRIHSLSSFTSKVSHRGLY